MRPKGTAAELERRRRRAVALMRQGESPTVIARILGVHRRSLYRWRDQADTTTDGLRATPHPGRKRRLSDEQLQVLKALLQQGATAHGWPNNLWTAKRAGELIRRHFGISYHPEHVRKLLKKRLVWTSQKPALRAKERDEAKIAQWREEELPRIKKRSGSARGLPGFRG